MCRGSWIKKKGSKHMDTITSKQLYELITSGKMAVTLITSRYFNMIDMVDIIEKEDFMTDLEKSTQAGRFDIIEWKCNVNTKGTVILTADLHDTNVGEYIEVLGKASAGMSIKQFEDDLG